MKTVLQVFCVFFLVGLVGCSSLTIYRDFDSDIDFSQYRKYVWLTGDSIPGNQLSRNPLMQKRVKAVVDSILAARGLQKVETERLADLMVLVYRGIEEKIEIEDWGGRERYSPSWRPVDEQLVTVDQYEEGTLTIDFVDLKREQMVWRGMAKKVLPGNRDPRKMEKLIKRVIEQILSPFPPVKK